MKKLVAIALIAAMATVANAGIGFVPVFGNLVMPGDVVRIQLIADGPSAGFSIGALGDGGKGGTVGNLWFPTGFLVLSEYIDNTSTALMDTVTAYASGNSLAAGTVLFQFDYTLPVGVWWEITIAPLAAGTMFVDAFGDTYAAEPSSGNVGTETLAIDGVTLSIIPEPMTLGLLGLGSLFMRRHMA